MIARKVIFWTVAAGIALGGVAAWAQVRNEVLFRSPGALRGVGNSGAVASFRGYSYGLGALQSSYGAPTSNPLRSAIESRASYSIGRSGVAAGVGGASPLDLTATRARAYRPVGGGLSAGAAGYESGGALSTSSRLLRATSSYLGALGGQQEDMGIATRLAPVTSLAAGGSDQFSMYMSQGEKAFRIGDFETALDRFKMANTLDSKNPESLLSLAHTSFAISKFSYYRASYYLTKALRYLPELPLAPLQPKAFFASPEQYTERLGWLDKHLSANPFDNDAFFVCAYLRWFDGDIQGAQQALAKARSGKVNPDLLEAIDTFWDGMKASGKVSGTLDAPVIVEPTTSPAAPTTEPVSAETPISATP